MVLAPGIRILAPEQRTQESSAFSTRFAYGLGPRGGLLARRLARLLGLAALDLALQVQQRVLDVAAHDRRRELVAQPAEETARGVVAQAEHHAGAVRAALAQPPAPSLVEAEHARPGHVAGLL